MNDTYTDSLVIDFEHEDNEKMEHLLVHIANMQTDFDSRNKKLAIEVIAYGAGIMHFTNDRDFAGTIADLQARNVAFRVCKNAMNAFEIDSKQLLDGVTVVPSGAAHIVEAQLDGSVYFKA